MSENPANPNDPTVPRFSGPKRNPKAKKDLYGLSFPVVMDAVAIELHMIQKGGTWRGKQGQTIGMGNFYHYKRLQQLLWPQDSHHRWSDLMLSEILNNTITAILGPKDCIAGHTRIPNPITGENPTVEELCNAGIHPVVMTLNGPVVASVPWLKGEDDLYEVTCTNGKRFTATAGHLVLTKSGYSQVKHLSIGQILSGYIPSFQQPASSSLACFQKPYALQVSQKDADSQFCYQSLFRFYDEPLPSVSNTYQDAFPSQACAQKHIHSNWPSDGSGLELEHIHDSQLSSRHSTLNFCRPTPQREKHAKSPHSPKPFLQHNSPRGQPSLYLQRLHYLEPFSESNPCYAALRLDTAYEYELISNQLQIGLGFFSLFGDCNQTSRQLKQQPCSPKRISLTPHALIGSEYDNDDACSQFKKCESAIKEIKHVGKGRFYDLTVPNEHHYFAEGFIHHNSGKTHVALTRYALTDYFAFPQNTLILISSTDVRGLELRVWGDIKTMFNAAKKRYPSLPGFLVDSKHAICTDNLIEDGTRDLRRGLIAIPCMASGGQWQGLGKYVGIKQKRRRLLGDEANLMKAGYLDALANLNSGTGDGHDFKGVFVGNPLGIGDPLDRIAEPKNGWGTEGEITKTAVWENRFENGRTINLLGTDSPNFDYPADQPPKYPWMINQRSIDAVANFYGKDSLQYWSQCKGVRKAGLNGRRVFTRNLAIKFKAFEEVAWKNDQQVRIYAVDAAYGEVGGDRCVGGWGSFGKDVNGDMILHMNPHVIIPVKAGTDTSAEDQIAEFVRQDCISLKIPAENVYYDATGRGSLGTAFARIWSPFVNPVEFGGRATNRQVSAELMIVDPETQKMRPKTCYEHFSKFVTELWFMARYVIESGQMRGLTEEVLEDGSTREWKMVTGNRIEIEAKIDTKERMGRSPDLMDWWVTVVEGARQKGFQLRSLAAPQKPQNDDWKDTLRKKAMDLHHAGALNYSA